MVGLRGNMSKPYTIEDIKNIGEAGGKTVRWIKKQGMKLTDFTEEEVNEIILGFLLNNTPPVIDFHKLKNHPTVQQHFNRMPKESNHENT